MMAHVPCAPVRPAAVRPAGVRSASIRLLTGAAERSRPGGAGRTGAPRAGARDEELR
jgi:hypothetical protein